MEMKFKWKSKFGLNWLNVTEMIINDNQWLSYV